MSKKIFLSFVWVSVLFRFLICSVQASAQPNIIFFLLDDLGTADVSFYHQIFNHGQEAPIDTPNIDQLAQASIQLKNYYLHTICGPTRCAFLTGRSAESIGNPFPTFQGGSLAPNMRTVGHELQARGYRTHLVGKWGVDYPDADGPTEGGPTMEKINGKGVSGGKTPLNRGFSTFYGLYSSGHNHFTKEIFRKGVVDWHRHNETHLLDYPQVDCEPTLYSTHLFVREGKEIIGRWEKGRPEFLFLSFTAPHDPLQVVEKYISPETKCGKIKNWRRRVFCGMVLAVDEGIGEIVSLLKEKDLFDETIILFSTDNGGAPSVGGFNYPYRGQKATVYQGGIRGPGFIRFPPSVLSSFSSSPEKPPSIFKDLFHISDFTPTLLSVIDKVADRPHSHSLGDINGLDQSLALLGKEKGQRKNIMEFNIARNHSILIQDNWKLILGNAGRRFRFNEPKTIWYDADERPFFVVEEFLCDLIDKTYTNWFVLTWALRFQIDRFRAFMEGEPFVATDPLGALDEETLTVPVLDQFLPFIEWDSIDLHRLQLFNLEEDPYENENVADKFPERVQQMVHDIHSHIQRDTPHHAAILVQFLMLMKLVTIGFTVFFVVGFIGFILVVYCAYKCIFSSPKKKRD